MAKHEGLLENLTISIDRWLVPPKPRRIVQVKIDCFRFFRTAPFICFYCTLLYFIGQAGRDLFSAVPRLFSTTYFRNNAQLIFFYILFATLNLGLVASRLVEYRNSKNVDGSRNW